MTRLLREHASRHSVPGAAVGILRDSRVSAAYCGVSDAATSEPVTPETRFAVGSLAKSMVATAVARLVAAEQLALDDPVAAHVPEVRGTGWGDAATLRDLLGNRSGLPLHEAFEFGDPQAADDGVLSRFAAMVAKGQAAPGFWSYTNAGWCVLGRAIETVTGLTWEDAMRAHVFGPLELDGATFVASRANEPRASGHRVTVEGVESVAVWSPRSLGPAGSTLLCTLTDVLRFAGAHLDDPSLAVLRTTQAEIQIHAWFDAWCLGLARFDWPGGPVWGWDGVISGQRAILRLVPQKRGAIALLTNAANGRALYRSLFPPLMEDAFGIAVPPAQLTPPGDGGDLSRFEGVYAWPDRRLVVTADEHGLTIDGDDTIVRAAQLDDHVFLVDPDDPDDPAVTFASFDADGRPGVLYRMLWGLPRV